MNDKLIILDLDETLVYASEVSLGYDHAFEAGYYLIYKRPYLEEFIQFCLANFKVAVWTSSGEDYASAVVESLFENKEKLEFFWSRNRCIQRFDPVRYEQYFIKDLKKVKKRGYSLNHTIMIDDTPEKLIRNYGNLLRVTPFEGDRDDQELLGLISYLDELRFVENVRSIEKRAWKRKKV